MRGAYQNKQVVIVGAGKTGMALVDYFLRQQAQVVLSDRRSAAQIDTAKELLQAGVTFDCDGHDPALFCAADLIVVSPGVSLELPALRAASAEAVPIVGEIEVAFRELDGTPLIGITGTNGKSTTTTLMGAIFAAGGRQPFVGGNLGTPLIAALNKRWDIMVVELSSFQLEAIETFRPNYALLLNLSEDHLDRYPDMASYIAAKARLFENMTANDVVIYNGDDPAVVELVVATAARKVPFSSSRLPSAATAMGLENQQIIWRCDGEEFRFDVGQLKLRGQHNIENVMAAMMPPLMEGYAPEQVWDTVCEFRGLSHRMELVRELAGVSWYNDSKGTNVGSVVKSLAGLDFPVTLIAGGKDKGGDYGLLRKSLSERVAHLILIGEAAGRMAAELGDSTHTILADNLDEAVAVARELTPTGGSVLLSPGCSSFDMFNGYEARGEHFKMVVNALDEQQVSA